MKSAIEEFEELGAAFADLTRVIREVMAEPFGWASIIIFHWRCRRFFRMLDRGVSGKRRSGG